jgi:hypothetical protein
MSGLLCWSSVGLASVDDVQGYRFAVPELVARVTLGNMRSPPGWQQRADRGIGL